MSLGPHLSYRAEKSVAPSSTGSRTTSVRCRGKWEEAASPHGPHHSHQFNSPHVLYLQVSPGDL